MTGTASPARPVHAGPTFAARSVWAGVAAALAMAAFYVIVIRGASGSWVHLRQQVSDDGAYLAFIIGGFGTQVALLVELRRRHRLDHATARVGGAATGASTVGMVACCAHHLADLLPVIGATGAVTFLSDQRIPVMAIGIAVNTVGVLIAARRLHRSTLSDHISHEKAVDRCATS